jgi:hypothetical protein
MDMLLLRESMPQAAAGRQFDFGHPGALFFGGDFRAPARRNGRENGPEAGRGVFFLDFSGRKTAHSRA